MAYNLMAISELPFDWEAVNKAFQNVDHKFEVFPIADTAIGDAIGISIPTKRFNHQAWEIVSKFLSALGESYPLHVYDLYSGCEIDIKTYVPDSLED